MAVTIVSVGGKPLPFVEEGAAHYRTLLKKWCDVTFDRLKDHNHEPPEAQVRKETAGALQFLKRRKGPRVLLDAGGRAFDSPRFAAFLGGLLAGSHNIIFLIGGNRGFGEEIARAVDHRISLSPLTLNHLVARLVLMEQLFRAFSILHQTSYHR